MSHFPVSGGCSFFLYKKKGCSPARETAIRQVIDCTNSAFAIQALDLPSYNLLFI